jgi:hypothetical protein
VIISLKSINRLVFLMNTRIFCEEGTRILNVIWTNNMTADIQVTKPTSKLRIFYIWYVTQIVTIVLCVMSASY